MFTPSDEKLIGSAINEHTAALCHSQNRLDDLEKRMAGIEGTLEVMSQKLRGFSGVLCEREKNEARLLAELQERIAQLEVRFLSTSSDLGDVEDYLDGHSVLIRQVAARVGLSLYEQQRILDEPSNRHVPHDHPPK